MDQTKTMEAKYLAIYKLEGISTLPGNAETIDFANLEKDRLTGKLTTNPDAFCLPIDCSNVLKNSLLNIFTGHGSGIPLSECLPDLLNAQKEQRNKGGKGTYLVIEATSFIDNPDLKVRKDLEDFSFSIDSFVSISKKYRYLIQLMITALTSNLDANIGRGIIEVGNVTYLIDPISRKPICSLNLNFEAAASVSSQLSGSNLENARKSFQILFKHPSLLPIIDLLAESQEIKNSELRIFVLAWAALELFVKRVFEEFYRESISSHSQAIQQYLTPPHNPKKFHLKQKFWSLVFILDNQSLKTDTEIFDEVYEIRNAMYHEGKQIHYPIDKVQKILQKYIYLHVLKYHPN